MTLLSRSLRSSLFALCLLLPVAASSQEPVFPAPDDLKQACQPSAVTDSVYVLVDVLPQFDGGQKALDRYVKKNLMYPAAAKAKKIQGVVFVSFVVRADGSLSDIKPANKPTLSSKARLCAS